jgi:hypothetical protein
VTPALAGALGAADLPHLTAVRSPVNGGIFYVAAGTGRGVALWTANDPAFATGRGIIVPLSAAARAAAPRYAGVRASRYGVSSSDVDARAAATCLTF